MFRGESRGDKFIDWLITHKKAAGFTVALIVGLLAAATTVDVPQVIETMTGKNVLPACPQSDSGIGLFGMGFVHTPYGDWVCAK